MTFETVAENLRESFRVIAASRGAGELRELRGVSIASSGVTFQMFNAAFLSGPVGHESELAQRILVHACYAQARQARIWSVNVRVMPADGPTTFVGEIRVGA